MVRELLQSSYQSHQVQNGSAHGGVIEEGIEIRLRDSILDPLVSMLLSCRWVVNKIMHEFPKPINDKGAIRKGMEWHEGY